MALARRTTIAELSDHLEPEDCETLMKILNIDALFHYRLEGMRDGAQYQRHEQGYFNLLLATEDVLEKPILDHYRMEYERVRRKEDL